MMTNVKVGPLSAVSPETLRSVYRVLVWNCVEREPQRPPNYPTEEDERVALEFARAIRLACEEGEEALPNVGQSWEEWDLVWPRKGELDRIIDEPLFGKAGE